MTYMRDLTRDLMGEIQRRESELEALRSAHEALTGTTSIVAQVARRGRPPKAQAAVAKPRRRAKKADKEQVRTAVEAYLREHAIGKGVFPRQVKEGTGFTSAQIKNVADSLKAEGKLLGRGAAKNAQWYWKGEDVPRPGTGDTDPVTLHVQTDGVSKRTRKKHEKGEIEVAYTTEEPAPTENGATPEKTAS